MRQVGRLVKWDESRGFGFIQPDGGGPQVFVHITRIAGRRAPAVGDPLSFEVARDLQNRLSAAHVRHADVAAPARDAPERKAPNRKARGRGAPERKAARRDSPAAGHPWPAALVGIAALLAVGLAALFGRLPVFIPIVFVATSLVVFLVYAFDKSAAMNRRRRTPENVLHLMNVLGGWPGGLFASQLFHHKSKKEEFRAVFYFCIVLNCAAIGWLVYARPF